MTMQTLKYKGVYVHLYGGNSKVVVQWFNGSDFYTKELKSFHAAKLYITKHLSNK
jgi:hypothetical protein